MKAGNRESGIGDGGSRSARQRKPVASLPIAFGCADCFRKHDRQFVRVRMPAGYATRPLARFPIPDSRFTVSS